MAVQLADLVPAFEVEINPPGGDIYPNVTASQLELMLTNAFWEARLNGLLGGYKEENGVILPISGSVDLPRDQQQIIILYAAYRVVLASFQNLTSEIRSKAGPVEYETRQQASILKGVLDALRDRMKLVLSTSEAFSGTDVTVFDAYLERTESIASGSSVWVQ